MIFNGNCQIATVYFFGINGRIFYSKHFGNRRPENIGIEQTSFIAFFCQSNGKIGTHRAFSHTAFSRCHGDNIFHAGQQIGQCRTRRLFGFHRNISFYLDIRIGISQNRLLRHFHQRFNERIVLPFGDERKTHFHSVDTDIVFHHSGRNNVLSRSRVAHVFECVNN